MENVIKNCAKRTFNRWISRKYLFGNKKNYNWITEIKINKKIC